MCMSACVLFHVLENDQRSMVYLCFQSCYKLGLSHPLKGAFFFFFFIFFFREEKLDNVWFVFIVLISLGFDFYQFLNFSFSSPKPPILFSHVLSVPTCYLFLSRLSPFLPFTSCSPLFPPAFPTFGMELWVFCGVPETFKLLLNPGNRRQGGGVGRSILLRVSSLVLNLKPYDLPLHPSSLFLAHFPKIFFSNFLTHFPAIYISLACLFQYVF